MVTHPRLYRVVALTAGVVAACAACKGTEPFVPRATTVQLNTATVNFVSLGASQQLTATVLDQRGDPIAGASLTWASNNIAAATVNGSGLVTAVGNGSAQVTAQSGTLNSSPANVTVAQAAAALVLVEGNAQTDTVGQQLPTVLTVQANDALGSPVAGVAVGFVVTQGGGSLSAPSAVTTANGQAAVSWTIGTIAGAAQAVTVSAAGTSTVTFSATAVADAAAVLVLVSGNNQQGQPGTALSAPIVVRVNDQFGNPVSARTVDFVVTSGGGSVNPTSAPTGANGQAQTAWTLGPGLGAQTLEAQSGALNGAPVAISAAATNLTLTNVQPDTLVEGQSATLNGDGFSSTAADNTVMIGGVAAVVTAASQTSLTATVPSFGCQPARDVGVTVTVGGGTTDPVTQRLHPTAFVNLAVGEQLIAQDPAEFCLQFRPSATGGDSYLVGVGAAAEIPSSVLPFSLTTVTGGTVAVAAAAASPPLAPGITPAAVRPDLGRLARRTAQWRAERRLREWEARNLPRLAANRVTIAARPAAAAMVPPSVGDTIRFRIGNLSGNVCDTVRSVLTRVRVVGTAGAWVTDVNNPPTDSFTTAEIQAYSDTFDTKIYAVDTLYFGVTSDIDNTQRIFIVLTIEVNKLGPEGFVSGGDLFSRSLCTSSNQGEIYYGHVPDPTNVAGTGARSKASIFFDMPALIAHEFAHIIQFSRRLVLASGVFPSAWEAEGQAVLAEEVVGHSVLGNTTGQNYGAAVAFGANAGDRWYQFAFVTLALFYGWDGSGTTNADTVPNAPALCTLFGSSQFATNCDASAVYGVSWAFLRHLSDRFGPTYPGGETQLHRDLIGKTVGDRGVPNIQALLGLNFDSLFSQWGGMLYVDDRVPGAAAPVTMTSWNMFNVFNAFVSDAFRLDPTARSWGTFTDARSVRSGSNAYTRLSSIGARAALALRVRDPADGTLGTGLRPRLWVVRLQ